MKKIFYLLIVIFISLYFTNCKKSGNLAPVPISTNVTNYDSTNNIFRVKASSANVNYTITVITKNAASGNQIDQENGIESAGSAFEYPFTPTIGDSVKITAQSPTGSVYLYPLYKGILLTGVITQNQTGGGTIASFSYLVTK
jgi:hypothetical protein